jgi:NSS family neurotransmitter:Na+ symporter
LRRGLGSGEVRAELEGLLPPQPDFEVLMKPSVWSAAFGQAFFSLSVGYGALVTYGSYLDKQIDITQSSIIISVADV